MGNLVGRLTGGVHEEIILLHEATMQSKSDFSLDADQEIERSKAHWSELRGVGDSDGDEDSDSDEDIDGDEIGNDYVDSDEEDVIRENRKVFSELHDDPQWRNLEHGPFFDGFVRLSVLGRKIAEGGQADIFERLDANGNVSDKILFKVFKKGSRISQLRHQWPARILQYKTLQVAWKGLLLEDGRFAFAMLKCWGDLRKLIDQAMQAKNNQGPPFPFEWNGVTLHALHIMLAIAMLMSLLHKEGIVHRDIKASNILLFKKVSYPHVVVADFECSIGVFGTRFWRAPEILLGLKNKTPIDYSEKVDVYGYAMTCYEIVTGLLPFDSEQDAKCIDEVIRGQRPKLPSDLDVALKGLIERCWDPNPLKRPTFSEIWKTLSSMVVLWSL